MRPQAHLALGPNKAGRAHANATNDVKDINKVKISLGEYCENHRISRKGD